MRARSGSTCSGAGMLDRAVDSLFGTAPAWHAEVDAAASKVLAAHWPTVPNLGDMTAVDWSRVEPVEVFAGGWPCQPFSAAGKQMGSADDRHLWPYVAQALSVLRPKVFVGENVPALLTIEHGRVFARVLADLNALGYTVAWTTVGACKVGACHHRHRVFILATLDKVEPPEEMLFGLPLAAAGKWPPSGLVMDGMAWPLSVATCGTEGLALPTPTARDATRGAGRKDPAGAPLSEVIALLPTPTARTGDARRGAPSAEVAARRFALGRRNLDDAVALLPNTSRDMVAQPLRFGQYEAAVRRQEMAFGLSAPDPTEPGRLGNPRLSPHFAEWMIGLPSGWVTDVVGRSDAIRIAGNGVVGDAVTYALPTLPTFLAAVAALSREAVAA